MLLAKLSCGMGHNSYGEAAWPNDIVYIFAVLIYGLSIACPLEIMSCSNAFSTPLEIVPEWVSPTVLLTYCVLWLPKE